MSEDVEKQVDNFYKTTGIPGPALEEYFDDPRNFTPELWKRMQGDREAFEEKIGKIVHVDLKKKKIQKKKEQPSKSRKGKTLGSRKGWMPMK